MRKEDLFRAIGDVRDEMILEAEPVRKKNTLLWKVLPMAAAAVLVAGGAFFVIQTNLLSQKSGDSAIPAAYEEAGGNLPKEETATVPENKDELPEEPEPQKEEDSVHADTTSPAIAPGEYPAIAEGDNDEAIEAEIEVVAEAEEADQAAMEEAADETEAVAEREEERAGAPAAEEDMTNTAEIASVCSINLEERELQKESTVQELSKGLSIGAKLDPQRISIPAMIQSLDYSNLLPQDTDVRFCGELVILKQGNGLLLVHAEAESNECITLYAQLPEDMVSGIRLYGDPEYITPVGNVEILSEEVSSGDTRTVLLDLELNKNANAGKMNVQLQLVTDDGEVYKVETCTLKAAVEAKMSGSMRLAYAAGQTGVLLRDGGKDQKSTYQRILVDLQELPDDSGAAALKELINYLIKD